MKRDWDLIRDILLKCEDAPAGRLMLQASDFLHPDKATLTEHVEILGKAGFLTVHEISTGDPDFLILGFTWDGQDLLALMRSDTWWAKLKKLAAEKGLDLTFAVIKELAPFAVKALSS